MTFIFLLTSCELLVKDAEQINCVCALFSSIQGVQEKTPFSEIGSLLTKDFFLGHPVLATKENLTIIIYWLFFGNYYLLNVHGFSKSLHDKQKRKWCRHGSFICLGVNDLAKFIQYRVVVIIICCESSSWSQLCSLILQHGQVERTSFCFPGVAHLWPEEIFFVWNSFTPFLIQLS